jgi:hypothetical protein
MAQVIIYVTNKGNVAVCFPTGEIPIEQVLIKDCPPEAIIVDESDLPSDTNSEFFDAWELVDGKIQISLEKSKEITKNRLRAERVPLFQAQDVAFQKALESNSSTSNIVVEKQRLRDLPALADVCNSLDELRVLKA